ncbi:MAG: MFS transporter [Myxococcota bacterium]|nr:MFS transporter [Myxococcota bacterium]
MSSNPRPQRFLILCCLIMIGELIFALPFHVTRFFRPTVLEVFEFTNFELGAMFSAYGVTAMVAYLPGGAIADRFSPRRLMAISAFTTALGGVYMVTIPSVMGMTLLYGYWGVTSILLFWAALIRSTRAAGGASEQGQVFGLLDAGRGLVAAGVASGVVWLYSSLLPVDAAAATVAERTLGLQWVIWSYTGLTVFAGLLVWFFIPEEEGEGRSSSDAFNPARIRQVLAMPTVWLIALIVICAYCGFKAIDNYAVFVVDAYGMSDVEGAQLSTWAAWIRPVSALVIGIGSDRLSTGKSTAWCFGILACSYLGFVLHEPIPGKTAILYITIFISAVVIYGLRALYFALMETSKVPIAMTGTAVGVISLVGYTPDIFLMPIAGWLIDRSPGAQGHQDFFTLMLGIALLGLGVVLGLNRQTKAGDLNRSNTH